MTAIALDWVDFRRRSSDPPNPAFPKGKDVDAAGGKQPRCRVALSYPAPRCGAWVANCSICGLSAMVTTAGRADDPRSLTVACKLTVATSSKEENMDENQTTTDDSEAQTTDAAATEQPAADESTATEAADSQSQQEQPQS